jgi:hypothetical protein
MKFWKLLTDAKFTGSPSKLKEEDIKRMGKDVRIIEMEIEAAIRRLHEFMNQKIASIPSSF